MPQRICRDQKSKLNSQHHLITRQERGVSKTGSSSQRFLYDTL